MLITPPFARRVAPPAFFLLLCAALLPALAGCGTKAENARKVQDTLQEALRHAQVDPDDKQARQWADRAVALAPNDPVTYFGDPSANASLSPLSLPPLSLDLIFGGAGVEDDTALADYMAQAVQRFPDDERGYQELIDADTRLGRDADRQKTARALVALLTRKLNHPAQTDMETLDLALAQAYWDSGDAVNGALKGQAAVGAYPASPLPPNNLAYAYAVANTHLPEALALAQKAITLAHSKNLSDEEIAEYQDTLGWVQYRQGHFSDAEASLQQAASVLPRQPETRYHLGAVYTAEGKTDAARAEFGHALLLSPGYADAQTALAKLPKAATS